LLQGRGEADAESKSSESPAPAASRRKWTLTQDAFDRLLATLGEDRERAGEVYVEIRANLVRVFEWRGCPFPEDHADETFNRVAKRAAGEEQILNPMSYCLGVARMLLLEINRDRVKEAQAMTEMAASSPASHESSESEAPLDCLRQCLEALSPDNRELII